MARAGSRAACTVRLKGGLAGGTRAKPCEGFVSEQRERANRLGRRVAVAGRVAGRQARPAAEEHSARPTVFHAENGQPLGST